MSFIHLRDLQCGGAMRSPPNLSPDEVMRSLGRAPKLLSFSRFPATCEEADLSKVGSLWFWCVNMDLKNI